MSNELNYYIIINYYFIIIYILLIIIIIINKNNKCVHVYIHVPDRTTCVSSTTQRAPPSTATTHAIQDVKA